MAETPSLYIQPTLIEKAGDELVLTTPPEGLSTQRDDKSDELWSPEEAIAPPENLEMLSRLSDYSNMRGSCIEAIARSSVGLGYDVVTAPFHEDEASEDERHKVMETLEALAARDRRLDTPTFSDLMFAVKTDEEECGQGYLEVTRNRKDGTISGLFHAPGHMVRRKRSREGWIMGEQVELGADYNTTHYYNFGDKVEADDDGKATPKLQAGKKWKVNELIPFRLYTSRSRDYGLPRDIALIIEYLAAKYCDEWNAGFFDSSGTPPTLIFIQGEEKRDGTRIRVTVPEEVMTRIGEALRSDANRQRRVAVIPVPAGMNADKVDLGKISERDIGFNEFKKAHHGNVLTAFRLSPIFVAMVDDGGRYTAEVQRSISLEQVFDPEQRRYEERLHETILRDLGVANMAVKFKRLAVEDSATRRESADKAAEVGAITMGEYREAQGLPPLDEEVFGEGSNDKLLDAGKPRGAEDRVRAPLDQRGLRPGIGGRVEKAEENGSQISHGDHGDPETEDEVRQLQKELAEMIPAERPPEPDDD